MEADFSPTANKSAWRKRLRQLRVSPGPIVDEQIVAGLAAFLDQRPGLFLFYRAMQTEIALDALADQLGWEKFATTRTPQSGGLTIHSSMGLMEQHPHGYTQPIEGVAQIPVERISVALVPGLAFDLQGNRLGQGAGYYDELLTRVPNDCVRVGVVTEEFTFEKLPVEPHDIPMTHIASESGVTAVGKQSW